MSFLGETAYDSYFTTPVGHTGVTFLAASGDSGSYDPSTGRTVVDYPAASPDVVGVGGSTVETDSVGDYLTETAWGTGPRRRRPGGSGGGISSFESEPSFQTGVVTQTTTKLGGAGCVD